MRDLKHLNYFENLLTSAHNDLVRQAKEEGRICAASVCENVPEPLFNLPGCFGVRLTAPNTGSLDISTFYMTSFLCETSRALLERAIEGGYNFADCIIAPDGCTMINRAVENMELLNALGQSKEHFFYENMEIPFKTDENGVNLLILQCKNHILTPLKENYGIDTSDAAIKTAVREHNKICDLVNRLGAFRKEENPRITGYEFAVFTLATYVCPKDLIMDKLEETIAEVAEREPDENAYRARVLMVGAEMDDPAFVKLIEECGAFVCADRFCFGSMPGRTPIEMNESEDALTQLCRHYTYTGQCPRHMNLDKVNARRDYVDKIAREYHADGIIYNQIKFCDPWGYERATAGAALRDDYGYPVLSVDRPYNIQSSAGQMRTRVQAFVESIEYKNIKGAK